MLFSFYSILKFKNVLALNIIEKKGIVKQPILYANLVKMIVMDNEV